MKKEQETLMREILTEIDDYAKKLGYDDVHINSINFDKAECAFEFHKITSKMQFDTYYIVEWKEVKGKCRNLVDSFDYKVQFDAGKCVFDNNGYQIDGQYRLWL